MYNNQPNWFKKKKFSVDFNKFGEKKNYIYRIRNVYISA